MKLFVQLLVQGLEHGSVYALWALAYSLVYQVLGLLNFAFGDALLLAVYVIVALVTVDGVPVWLSLLAGLCLASILFALLERGVLSRFVRKGEAEMGFIAAIACAYIFRNIATILLGNEPVAFPSLFPNSVFTVSGIKLSSSGLIVLGVTGVVLLALTGYLYFSRLGRGIVLAGQDPTMARVIGVPLRRIVTVVYAVSGALGLIGTVLFANLTSGVSSDTGFYITFQAFVAATVGGVGSLAGSVIGGLGLGVVEALAVGYVSGNFSQALAWGAMAAVVLIRPRGLLGRQVVERV